MSENDTKNLFGGKSFEEYVIAEFAALRRSLDTRLERVENRLITLEERVDARLTETRPIWEAVQASIIRLDQKFDTVIEELFEMRTDMRLHRNMLNAHERRLNP
jgi:hypothetical protein